MKKIFLVRPYLAFVCTLVLTLIASTSFATGRTELNQAVIEAAGGFPYTINEPGNYVLTGPLVVPASTNGFMLFTNEVVFDLNGFSISGPATCNTSSCPLGTGTAIRGVSGIAHARRTTVRNGSIRGFGDNCLTLGPTERVDELLVTECGRTGIGGAGGGVLTNNRVLQTGEAGIVMSGSTQPSSFGGDTFAFAWLGASSGAAVSGGIASSANSCDDGSCGPLSTRRRFYLSTGTSLGADALAQCTTGFHMASLWEIYDPSALFYDTSLGRSADDSGSGPPAGYDGRGRVRTGGASRTTIIAGNGNCDSWTSSSSSHAGAVVFLVSNWWDSVANPEYLTLPWGSDNDDLCSAPRPVWCIED